MITWCDTFEDAKDDARRLAETTGQEVYIIYRHPQRQWAASPDQPRTDLGETHVGSVTPESWYVR